MSHTGNVMVFTAARPATPRLVRRGNIDPSAGSVIVRGSDGGVETARRHVGVSLSSSANQGSS